MVQMNVWVSRLTFGYIFPKLVKDREGQNIRGWLVLFTEKECKNKKTILIEHQSVGTLSLM
jgi:hypothetical protein